MSNELAAASKLNRRAVLRDIIKQIDTGVANADAHYADVMEATGVTPLDVRRALAYRGISLVFGPVLSAFVTSIILSFVDTANLNAMYEAHLAVLMATLTQQALLFTLSLLRRPLGGTSAALAHSAFATAATCAYFFAIQAFIGPAWWVVGLAKVTVLGAIVFGVPSAALGWRICFTTSFRSALAKK